MSKKHGDFTTKPRSGWVHDTAALSTPNLFFSYPAIYLGSIAIDKSLRPLSPDEQSLLTRDLIHLVAVATEARAPRRQLSPGHLTPYMQGQQTPVDADVNLNISAKGFMIVPVELQEDGSVKEVGMLEFSQMQLISLAAGGEDEDYDLICYVAKNEFGLRECYVFDCGSHSQEVLETMGQAFSIANGIEKPKAAAKTDPKAFNPYDTVPDSMLKRAGQVQTNASYSAADLPGDAYLEIDESVPSGFSNPLYDEMPSSMGAMVVSQYQHVDALPGLAEEDLYGDNPSEVVRKLNHVDKVRRCVREQTGQYFDISPEDQAPAVAPQWNYFDVSPGTEKVDVSAVRGKASVRKHWK